MISTFFLFILIVISSSAIGDFAIIIPDKSGLYVDIAETIQSSSNERSVIMLPADLSTDLNEYDFFVSIGEESYQSLMAEPYKDKAKIVSFVQRKEKPEPNVLYIYNDFDLKQQLQLINRLSNKKRINTGVIGVPWRSVNTENMRLHYKQYDKQDTLLRFVSRFILSENLDFLILSPSANISESEAFILMSYAFDNRVPLIAYTKKIVSSGAGATASVYFDRELVVKEIIRVIRLFSKSHVFFGESTPPKGKLITNPHLIKRYGLNFENHNK